ncbi:MULTISPECIES: ABC transporter permease [Oceanotoga]|uniref:Peptide/nickel transport system permease protein n=1 Tax=Oceanotoga teriensis TaxID=515440 RepID=A0AA45C8D9_9BACT|nr:ABC transporter permease [Oceanotoga teriensis]MDO7975567.1 ABC transporter permease [Oceanotoga teriensis]PWJ96144.1 peptide/nickel transport system permease protein [Oceanotoga teriensis]
MTSYIIRRILMLPIIMLGVTLIVFSMMQLLGEDKLVAAYIPQSQLDRLNDEQIDNIKEKYGLNDPLAIRYVKWLGNTLKGDLGWSIVGKQPTRSAILSRIPYTIELALYAIIPIIFVGIWLGVKAAVKHNSFTDNFIRIFALVGWSLPDFVFGLIILMVFYGVLGWFPPGNLSQWADEVIKSDSFKNVTNLISIDALINGRFDIFVDALRHIIAPVITLAYLWWAFLLRITRSAMLEVLKKDYIRTARAKGLSEKVVINKHAKRNALIPVTTVAGSMVIGLFIGTVFVETIFNRTGLGKFVADAATQLDYSSIMGSLLFYSLILVVGNLIIDILYAVIDPRIRLE